MKRLERGRFIACVVVAVLVIAAGAFAASASNRRKIVVFVAGTSPQVQQQVIARSGSRVLNVLSLINGVAIQLPEQGTAEALSTLQDDPTVKRVYDDAPLSAQAQVEAIAQGAGGDGAGGDGKFLTSVSDPQEEEHTWNHYQIRVPEALEDEDENLGQGVKVAILDTGVDCSHPDLKKNIVRGFNFLIPTDADQSSTDADPRQCFYADDNGHGTAMAGIIAASLNDWGVIGVAPKARLYALKVLDKDGKGSYSTVIAALGWVAARPDIRVVNMSFSTPIFHELFEPAILATYKLGKIMVVSRGNRCGTASTAAQGAGGDGAGGDGAGGDGAGGDGAGGDTACGPSAVRYPAVYPGVISVGATNAQRQVASYSLWGSVDVVAPGGEGNRKVLAPHAGGGFGLISGTSPAAAHVSAAVALVLQKNPTLSVDEVLALLQNTARDLDAPPEQQGAGLIDAERLMDAVRISHRQGGRGAD